MKSFKQILNEASPDRLDPSDKRKINAALAKAGLDGNGRFHDEIDFMIAVDRALKKTGYVRIDQQKSYRDFHGLMHFSGPIHGVQKAPITVKYEIGKELVSEDPVPMKNSLLILKVTAIDPHRCDVIAYLS